MSIKVVFIHIFIVFILSLAVVYFIHDDFPAGVADYISGIGSVASIYGIIITLWQLHLVKKKTDEYQDQVKAEVKNAQIKIKRGLTISIVDNAINYLSEAIRYAQRDQYELLKMRMEDCENILSEIGKSKEYIKPSQESIFRSRLWKYQDALYTVQKHVEDPSQINSNVVIDSLSKMRTELIEIKTNIKQSLYE